MSRLIGWAIALLAVQAVPAATLQQLSVNDMTQAATAIVRARVTSVSTSFTGSTIYTHYKLQVAESWKGFKPLEMMVPGGVANGYRQSFPGVPQLTAGTEYLMFLWTSSSTGITHLVGLSQGLFNLSQQSDGSMLATRPLIGETILDSLGRKVTDHAVSIPLAQMKTQVAQTLARKAVR